MRIAAALVLAALPSPGLYAATARDGVVLLAPPPLAPRGDTVVAWTGRELVVWGGDVEASMPRGGPPRSYRDGAAYNPGTRAWRSLRPSPLPASTDTPVAAMSSRGLVVVRGEATAVWNPVKNRWRRLDDLPLRCRRPCVRTGPVRDLTRVGNTLASYSAQATLDVRTGHWHDLPEPPRLVERFAVLSTGQQLIVIGGDSSLLPNTDAFALDVRGRSWHKLPSPPGLSQQAIAAGWDGERVVAVSYDMHAAAYDPRSGRWSALPSVPARFYEWVPSSVSVNGQSIVFMAQAVVVLDRAGTWKPLPYGDLPSYATAVVGAGGNVFVLGLNRDNRLTLAAIDLNRLTTQPARLQVGVASAAVPKGFTIAESSFDSNHRGAFTETVRVRIANPTGDTCTLTSTYGRQPDAAGKTPVSVATSGTLIDWYRTPDAEQWETAATTSDTVAVKCSNPALADQVVHSVAL